MTGLASPSSCFMQRMTMHFPSQARCMIISYPTEGMRKCSWLTGGQRASDCSSSSTEIRLMSKVRAFDFRARAGFHQLAQVEQTTQNHCDSSRIPSRNLVRTGILQGPPTHDIFDHLVQYDGFFVTLKFQNFLLQTNGTSNPPEEKASFQGASIIETTQWPLSLHSLSTNFPTTSKTKIKG